MIPLRHRRVATWLALSVVAAHIALTDTLLQKLAALQPSDTPPRIAVDFVAEVRLATPARPLAAPPPAPNKRSRHRAAAPQTAPPAAASAPEPVASGLAALPEIAPDLPQSPEPSASTPHTMADAASAAPNAASATEAVQHASSPTDLGWPPSARINFKLTGQYNGEVQGSAQVDWLLSGTHYQVHVDTYIGPRFAPIFRRSFSSDGEIGAQSLQPHRYDEETKVAFASAKRKFVVFDADEIELSEAQRREPRLPGVQDPASLFVQLTYILTTRQSPIAAGDVLVIPLALPRKQEAVNYDVLGIETLDTPLGPLSTVHVKPRLPPRPGKPDLTMELWFAPNLQYLPVRMRVWQDERNHIDMLISGPPLSGAPTSAPQTASRPSGPSNAP